MRRLIVIAALALLVPVAQAATVNSVFCDWIGRWFQTGFCPAQLTSPSAANVTSNSADIRATTDRDSGTLYCVHSTSPAAPSAATIKAGGTASVSAAGQYTVARSGLSQATTYYGHCIHEWERRDSNVVTTAQFTTPSSGTFTLAWDKPTELSDGTTITSELTGYKIYEGSDGTFDTLVTTINDANDTDHVVSSGGLYAVAATWTNGGLSSQTALSWPVDTSDVIETGDCTTTLGPPPSSKATFQAALDSATPGDVICVRGGTYEFDWNTSNVGLTFSVDGTAVNPITFTGYPGEWPIFNGYGTDAQWTTDEGNNQNGSSASLSGNQDLFTVNGDYWRLQDFQIEYADRHNLLINGSHVEVVNHRNFASWGGNINVGLNIGNAGFPITIDDVLFRHVESSFSRHGYGIILQHTGSSNPIADANKYTNIVTLMSSLWANGKRADTKGVVGATSGDGAGGGNADGFAISKELHPASTSGTLSDQAADDLTFAYTTSWFNADNQNDISAGNNFTYIGAITANKRGVTNPNGAVGAVGFKAFQNFDNGQLMLGSISTVVNEQGTLGWSFEHKMEPGASQSQMWNNTAVDINGAGYFITGDTFNTTDSKFKNNLNYLTGAPSVPAGYDNTNNYNGDTSGNPNLHDHLFTPSDPDVLSASGEPWERSELLHRQFIAAFVPTTSSTNLLDDGVTGPHHHATAADDPTNPSDPVSLTKIPFFDAQRTGDTNGDTDIGAVQYQYMLPPARMRIQ